ncbi:MAG: hypothetical protein R3E04_04270 [Sphingobium sp.]
MDDFYAARSSTSPPPPWSNFAPPFSDYDAKGRSDWRQKPLSQGIAAKLARFRQFEQQGRPISKALRNLKRLMRGDGNIAPHFLIRAKSLHFA